MKERVGRHPGLRNREYGPGSIFLAIALGALGVQAEEFRARAPITLQGTDPFQRVQLPEETYRDTRPDLGDLRVLNGRGEAVPLAFVEAPVPVRETPQRARLAQFPATAPATAAGADIPGRIDVRVRTLPDGTLVSVEQRGGARVAPATARASAYYLDASQLKYGIGSMTFDWEVKPGTEIVPVTIAASDDLRDWRTVARRTALVRLEQGGQVLSQAQVPLHGTRAKYYRVTSESGAFVLRSVDVESAPATTVEREPRKVTAAKATRTKEGDFVFDLTGRLPVEAIRVVFPEINSVAPFEIAVRDSPTAPWRAVTTATFYRIVRNGTEVASPALEIGVVPAREWRLRPQVKAAGEGQPPSIEVQWRPAELVFVARGDPPFTLAFGARDARATSIPVSSLIPNYERGAERKLAFATLGAVTTAPPPPPPMTIFGTTPRKAGLWAVLVIGVLVLGFMAWRLMGQMKG